MEIRKLEGKDICYIDTFQDEQGLARPGVSSIPEEWSVYGAFDGNRLVSVCYLFRYKRIPHQDYPTGVVAELGGAYTLKEYREKGIMSVLVDTLLKNSEHDLGKLDAIIADSTDEAYGIYKKCGAQDSTEHRIWWSLD